MEKFFTSERIHPNVLKITDISGVYCYFVEGNTHAALLDTGTGAGNIREYAATLTNLPTIVICTHGHVDHAGGTYGFDQVYLNEADLTMVEEHSKIEMRKGYVDMSLGGEQVAIEDYVPQRTDGYLPLTDGQIFDLGGIALQALTLPGHTAGMTCILIREARLLLLGDACNSSTFLFMPETCSVEEYKHNLESFLVHETQYDQVLFSHGDYLGDKIILHEAIELCGEIMNGHHDNIPFEFMDVKAILAKATHEDRSRLDGKTFNVIFNPKKIFKAQQ